VPYLSKTLPFQGVLLNQYYGTGHVSLDNYIAHDQRAPFDEGGLAVAPNPSGSGYVISAAGETCCNEKPGPNIGTFLKPSHWALTL
jgi:hypothetical protein